MRTGGSLARSRGSCDLNPQPSCSYRPIIIRHSIRRWLQNMLLLSSARGELLPPDAPLPTASQLRCSAGVPPRRAPMLPPRRLSFSPLDRIQIHLARRPCALRRCRPAPVLVPSGSSRPTQTSVATKPPFSSPCPHVQPRRRVLLCVSDPILD
jgi:hypothetical protein